MAPSVGTFETLENESAARRRAARLTSSQGRQGPGGGNGGGGNGGGKGPAPKNDRAGDEPVSADKSRILTAFLLLVVMMTFGGLIGAYVVVATNRALEWRPFDLPPLIWLSTALILISSITYEAGRRAVVARAVASARRWLVATAALGGVFVASQLLVWLTLVNRGFYLKGNPYAGFFYILTAVHAVHVLGGIVALGAVLLRNWYPTSLGPESLYRANIARSVGWYWHFMGGLWIALFLLLGFWK